MLGIDNRYPNLVGGLASFSRLERIDWGSHELHVDRCVVGDRPTWDAGDRARLVVLFEVHPGPVDGRAVAGRTDVDGAGREPGRRADDRLWCAEGLGDDLGEVLEEPRRRDGAVEDLVMLGVAEVVADLVEHEEVTLAER